MLVVPKFFEADKSLGPNGWLLELFIHYFEFMVNDLLQVVEESRISDIISGDINSTFIVLIAKSTCPKFFLDFQPISLGNVVYNLC